MSAPAPRPPRPLIELADVGYLLGLALVATGAWLLHGPGAACLAAGAVVLFTVLKEPRRAA